jgi:hypothetical protein
MGADTLKMNFEALEEQLRDVRRSMGLDAPVAPPAPEAVAPTATRTDAVTTVGSRPRRPVWDLLFLAAAWSGLIVLVVQAL